MSFLDGNRVEGWVECDKNHFSDAAFPLNNTEARQCINRGVQRGLCVGPLFRMKVCHKWTAFTHRFSNSTQSTLQLVPHIHPFMHTHIHTLAAVSTTGGNSLFVGGSLLSLRDTSPFSKEESRVWNCNATQIVLSVYSELVLLPRRATWADNKWSTYTGFDSIRSAIISTYDIIIHWVYNNV